MTTRRSRLASRALSACDFLLIVASLLLVAAFADVAFPTLRPALLALVAMASPDVSALLSDALPVVPV